jgi:hypothetical protein
MQAKQIAEEEAKRLAPLEQVRSRDFLNLSLSLEQRLPKFTFSDLVPVTFIA